MAAAEAEESGLLRGSWEATAAIMGDDADDEQRRRWEFVGDGEQQQRVLALVRSLAVFIVDCLCAPKSDLSSLCVSECARTAGV